jgi:hypothetical protein
MWELGKSELFAEIKVIRDKAIGVSPAQNRAKQRSATIGGRGPGWRRTEALTRSPFLAMSMSLDGYHSRRMASR